MALTAPLIKLTALEVEVESVAKGAVIASAPIETMAYDLVINPDMQFTQRKGVGKKMGNADTGVVGSPRVGTCTFTLEFKGTNSAGMELALAACLSACAVEATLQVYTPTSVHADQKTLTITVYENGVKKQLVGAAGNAEIYNSTEDGRILVDFEFKGRWIAPIDGAMPTIDHSVVQPFIWGTPPGAFLMDSLGVKISSFRFNLGNNVIVYPDAGNYGVAYCMVSDRDTTLTIDPDMDLIASYDFFGDWLAGSTVPISLILADGTDKATLVIPKFQIREIAESDRDNVMTNNVTGQTVFNAVDTGDDDFSLTVADDGV